MSASGMPQWMVREDASASILVALYLRQLLGLRAPEELPHVRGVAARTDESRSPEQQDILEAQWRTLWGMTVEPLAHPSPVPLELVDGFDDLIAIPSSGCERLHEAILPFGPDAAAYARSAHERYSATQRAAGTSSYRAYASAIAQHEREVGRPAHSFELNVQVLPLTQRGVWWIGALTVAVTDGLRSDVAAFDRAITPVISELA